MIVITVYGYSRLLRRKCEDFKILMEKEIRKNCQEFGLSTKKLQVVCVEKHISERLHIKIECIFLKEPPAGFESSMWASLDIALAELMISADIVKAIIIPKQFRASA